MSDLKYIYANQEDGEVSTSCSNAQDKFLASGLLAKIVDDVFSDVEIDERVVDSLDQAELRILTSFLKRKYNLDSKITPKDLL